MQYKAGSPLAGEEYELSTSQFDHHAHSPTTTRTRGDDIDEEPLLPRYEARPPSPTPLIVGRSERTRRRRSAICVALTCILVSLAVIVPSFVAAVCSYEKFGGGSIDSWDQLSGQMKDWIQSVVGTDVFNDDLNFPTNVGYAGPTPTGKEPALMVTAPAMPMYTAVAPLVPPPGKSDDFSIIQNWGNLSPYHSVKSHGLPESSAVIPPHCELKELHWLQRHGARYPTSNPEGPAGFAARIKSANGWKASGDLKFLNDWSYQLGAEILTPFGRSQLYNLGVAARVKYGFLLEKMDGRLPVFRTESQDRMLRSAQNFATGFFGIPAEEQYNLEVMIEAPGFNCTLAPYYGCPNDAKIGENVKNKVAQWDAVYLKDARKRLQKHISGYDVTLQDAKDMMEMCAYETVALGYSAFCTLFTEKEWRGFEYRNDIYWWYGASFGSPVSRAQGLGWVQELTARLTHTALTEFNSTTNSTLHDPVHFPLNDPLYVDFTHDTTFAQLLPAMNLTTFSDSGTPPLDHIPKHWSFVASKICPFATNLQVQVLSCSDRVAETDSDAVPESDGWWPFGGSESEKDDTPADERVKRAAAAAAAEENDETESYEIADGDDETSLDTAKVSASPSAVSGKYVRLILNDAPVPLTGIQGCPEDEDGLCDIGAFVAAMQTLIGDTDFAHDCNADYEYDVDDVVDGRPPPSR